MRHPRRSPAARAAQWQTVVMFCVCHGYAHLCVDVRYLRQVRASQNDRSAGPNDQTTKPLHAPVTLAWPALVATRNAPSRTAKHQRHFQTLVQKSIGNCATEIRLRQNCRYGAVQRGSRPFRV